MSERLNVLVHAPKNADRWCQALQQAAPGHAFQLQTDAPAEIDAWVGWAPPAGYFSDMTGLRLLLPMGAGVDALLGRDDLPPAASIVRLVDAGMAEQMVEYTLFAALNYQRGFQQYQTLQAEQRWQPLRRRSRRSVGIGVLGLGALGANVALELARFGYRVIGWSRGGKSLPGVDCRHGEQALDALLTESEVLIDLLPSTAATRGLLSRRRLQLLPPSAHLVMASRGDRYDPHALIDLLSSGHLGAAQIDVFACEPLPAEDPLWRCPGVRITPHVAAMTVLEQSVEQIIENLRRLCVGEPLLGEIDRQRGY